MIASNSYAYLSNRLTADLAFREIFQDKPIPILFKIFLASLANSDAATLDSSAVTQLYDPNSYFNQKIKDMMLLEIFINKLIHDTNLQLLEITQESREELAREMLDENSDDLIKEALLRLEISMLQRKEALDRIETEANLTNDIAAQIEKLMQQIKAQTHVITTLVKEIKSLEHQIKEKQTVLHKEIKLLSNNWELLSGLAASHIDKHITQTNGSPLPESQKKCLAIAMLANYLDEVAKVDSVDTVALDKKLRQTVENHGFAYSVKPQQSETPSFADHFINSRLSVNGQVKCMSELAKEVVQQERKVAQLQTEIKEICSDLVEKKGELSREVEHHNKLEAELDNILGCFESLDDAPPRGQFHTDNKLAEQTLHNTGRVFGK